MNFIIYDETINNMNNITIYYCIYIEITMLN